MTTTIGNKVLHAVIDKTTYTNLSTKDADTIYFVGDTNGMMLYKGLTLVGGGFAVLSSNPSDTTGMQEGILYLAPNGNLYYKSGSALATAFEITTEANLPAEGTTGNDGKIASIAAIYTAISTKIAAAMSGTYRSSVLAPVADVAALKAVTGQQDKDIIFVESLNALFSFDAQSTATGNDTTVVQPTSGSGRWLKTQAGFSYNATDFSWGTNGLELNLRIPSGASDGQILAWDATNGALKWVSKDTSIIIATSTPTVTVADNGKIYCIDGKLYKVENGELVAKSYTKGETDTLLLSKADVNDISWTVIS